MTIPSQTDELYPHVTSGSIFDTGDERISVKFKNPETKPQELLVQTNHHVVNLRKVNMQKRILAEESRRACGDEDKLFKETQKIITSTFNDERNSCHICKDKIEKPIKYIEKFVSSPTSLKNSANKKRTSTLKIVEKPQGKKNDKKKEIDKS